MVLPIVTASQSDDASASAEPPKPSPFEGMVGMAGSGGQGGAAAWHSFIACCMRRILKGLRYV